MRSGTVRDVKQRWVLVGVAALTVALLTMLMVSAAGGSAEDDSEETEQVQPISSGGATLGPMVVLGYNDLGMHCMNEGFADLCILPPFNTLHAQVIDRTGEDPKIVTRGVTVAYQIPGNTHSSDKTDFWTYAPLLFGTPLSADVGLTGNRLNGFMKATTTGDWSATGIPITPITDAGNEDPYQLAAITVLRRNVVVAQTRAVIPVSWEISCHLCHETDQLSATAHILRAHDIRHRTTLQKQRPVLCASCHADPALGTKGKLGVPSLSRAIHGAHASRMAGVPVTSTCYSCHPGFRTQCFRDVHYTKGMKCTDCHGGMTTVAKATRRPWVDEPRCSDCHKRAGFAFEETGKLFRDSRGHNGVHCPACHGSPHAITPAATKRDNLQSVTLQGQAGPIRKCTVCHKVQPTEPFEHRFEQEAQGGG